MSNHGGKRLGAGRPPIQRNPLTLAQAMEKMNEFTPEALELMFSLARGVTVEDANLKGHRQTDTRTYKTRPDYKALDWILGHTVGKPVERTDITSQGQSIEPLTVTQRQERLDSLMAEAMVRKLRAESLSGPIEERSETTPRALGTDGGNIGVEHSHRLDELQYSTENFNSKTELQHRLEPEEETQHVTVRRIEVD